MPHTPGSSADSDILDIDSAPSSTNTTSVADTSQFHRPIPPIIVHLRQKEIEQPLISPAISGFSFNIEQDESAFYEPYSTYQEVASLSFGPDPFESTAPHAVSRPPTGTSYRMDSPPTRSDSAAKRVQYFEDSFGNGASSSKESAKERIQRDSPIIADLRTNVIIKDEYTVVTNLSQHLSERYRRPESAILLTVTHSSCLMMGGSFEPAYILSISAIPSELQPVTNKRNAYLVQCFIADVLHVPSNRGVVRFQEVPAEKLATNGSTVAGDIERAEKTIQEKQSPSEEKSFGLVRSLTGKSSRRSLVAPKQLPTEDLPIRKGTPTTTTDQPPLRERRKSLFRTGGGGSVRKDSTEPLHTLDRKQSTRSLRSIKSFTFRDSISPPMPKPVALVQPFAIELPAESLPANSLPALPSPTSISDFYTKKDAKDLPKIHRLSPLHSMNGLQFSTAAANHYNAPPSPLSMHTPSLPPFAPTAREEKGSEREPFVASNSRRPSMNAIRPQSARRNLSNITGPADAIPSPPPIPVDEMPLRGKSLSKRKSFVAMFQRDKGSVRAV